MDAAEPEPDYAQQTDEEPEHPDYPPQDRYAPQGGYYDDADAAFARTSVDGDKGGWGDADWAEPPVDAPF